MKGVWKFSLSLSLGLWTGLAWADEVQWRAAAARTPTPPPTPEQSAPLARTPGVSLDKPVRSAAANPVVDPQLRPVSLSTPIPASRTATVRGQSAEPPQAAPVAPPVLDDEPAPVPKKVETGKPPEVAPGTIVLPPGTILPPGAILPPNVIIAPSTPRGTLVPTPQGPILQEGPILPGTVVPGTVVPGDAAPQIIGPVESLGGPDMMGSPGMGEYPDVSCGSPDVCCVTAESCYDGACCDGVCEGDCLLGHKRWWVNGEYLMWWIKGAPVPALLTSGTGFIGDPN